MKKILLSILCFIGGTVCLGYSILAEQPNIEIDQSVIQNQIKKAELNGKTEKNISTKYGSLNVSINEIDLTLQNEVFINFITNVKTEINNAKVNDLINKSVKLSQFVEKNKEKIDKFTNLDKSYRISAKATPYLKNSNEIYLKEVEVLDIISNGNGAQDEVTNLLKHKFKDELNTIIKSKLEQNPIYKIKSENKDGSTNWKMKIATMFLKDIKVIDGKIVVTIGL